MTYIDIYNSLKKAPISEGLQKLYAGACEVIDNNLDIEFEGVKCNAFVFNQIGMRMGRSVLESTCNTPYFPHEVPLITVCQVADAIERVLAQ